MRRAVLLLVMVVIVVLGLSGVALAATPQDIYNDFAADGHLDGKYTVDELRAYLSDALVHQYGNPSTINALDDVVHNMISDEERGDFPFTGMQLALMVVAAGLLVAAGIGLRKLVRSRS